MKPEPQHFEMAIACADANPPEARMEVLVGTAEALGRATRTDIAEGVYCLIWAAIRVARVHGKASPDKIVKMVADATALIMETEGREAADTKAGLH